MKGSTPKYCAYDNSRLCNINCSAFKPCKLPMPSASKGEAHYCGRGNFSIWIVHKEIQSE